MTAHGQDIELRHASERDASALLAIYIPIVERTATSFEVEPPSEAELAARVRSIQQHFPWLVAEVGGTLAGYAYASSFRTHASYRWVAETTVYTAGTHRSRGVARALYSALLELLQLQGFRKQMAAITLPNEASVRLHESFEFRPAGVWHAVGYKLGQWHDVGLWERTARAAAPPPELSSPDEVAASAAGRAALQRCRLIAEDCNHPGMIRGVARRSEER